MNAALVITDHITDSVGASDLSYGYWLESSVMTDVVPNVTATDIPIILTVVPSYANGDLGKASSLGKSMSYKVTVTNKATASVGQVRVVIRPPSCLGLNVPQMSALVTSKAIAYWDAAPQMGELTAYVRGLGKAGTATATATFTVTFPQKYFGQC